MIAREEEFSEAVQIALGHYVYRLVDPRDNRTFYVGKGVGNRIFSHITEARKKSGGVNVSEKVARIHAIWSEGEHVEHVIHRHGLQDESIASLVEAALIDLLPGLTNEQGGYHSSSYGPMTPREVIRAYDLPEFPEEFDEKIILINVNLLENRDDPEAILKHVECAWVISPTKASKADYVVAVVRGVAVGIFSNGPWVPATRDNFPRLQGDSPGRWGFQGSQVPESIWKKFIGGYGKRITSSRLKHEQNPIRYSYKK